MHTVVTAATVNLGNTLLQAPHTISTTYISTHTPYCPPRNDTTTGSVQKGLSNNTCVRVNKPTGVFYVPQRQHGGDTLDTKIAISTAQTEL